MLIDTHAHLMWDDFQNDLDGVLARAAAAGVGAMITVGTDLTTSATCVDLALRHAAVFAAVGVHPNDPHPLTDADWDRFEALARHPRVVAVGETGLDFYRTTAAPAHQEESLHRQLRIARRIDKPVIFHCREAMPRLLEILGPLAPIRGVMHCFAGDETAMRAYVELGLHISFAGPVTYPKSEALRRAATATPAERVLVETDCPFLAPQERRGKRNEPAFVALTAHTVAAARGQSDATFAQQSTANAVALFRLALPVGADAAQ